MHSASPFESYFQKEKATDIPTAFIISAISSVAYAIFSNSLAIATKVLLCFLPLSAYSVIY